MRILKYVAWRYFPHVGVNSFALADLVLAEMTKPFEYQRQDSELTLRHGLAEYYDRHPGLFRPSQLTEDSARFFRSHDIAHVVFGLDTTLNDEALADADLTSNRCQFATLCKLFAKQPEAQQLMKQIGWLTTASIS